jgi:hypothetical protein
MGTKISDLPTRVTPLGDDLFVLANDAEALNFKISLADLKIELGDIGVVYKTEVDDISSDLFYVGEAAPGSLSSSPVWRIKCVTSSGNDISMKWADNAQFSQIWDDRASLTYA